MATKSLEDYLSGEVTYLAQKNRSLRPARFSFLETFTEIHFWTRFWKSGAGKIDRWEAAIRDGAIPDFEYALMH